MKGLTIGCFDIFHFGHQNLLLKSMKFCDSLVILLHDDYSIFENKGHYPLQSYSYREKNLKEWAKNNKIKIDIIKLENSDPKFLIQDLDGKYIYFRGDDWFEFPGKKEIKKRGWEIKYFPYTTGISSTQLREQL